MKLLEFILFVVTIFLNIAFFCDVLLPYLGKNLSIVPYMVGAIGYIIISFVCIVMWIERLMKDD